VTATMRRGRIVVVGDAFLDRDVDGTTSRQCPDSTGPVIDVDVDVVRPGGAALTAALLARHGADVVLLTAVGADRAGAELRQECVRAGVELVGVPSGAPTPQKIRIRVAGSTMARVDLDCGDAGAPRVPASTLAVLDGAAGVLASDYGRGMLARPEVRARLRSLGRRVPLVWDPHPRGARPVASAAAATPNLAEAIAAVGSVAPADSLAERLTTMWRCPVVLTCGGDGAVVAQPGREVLHVAGTPVAGADACGAGDRFAGSLATSLVAGAALADAARTACADATRFVAGGAAAAGASAPSPSVLVAAGGCFDVLHAGHVRMLRHARSLGDRLVVLLNSDRSIARLKGPTRPVNPQEDRAEVLLGLGCVDEVVVFDGDDPTAELERLRPAVFVKGAEYAGRAIPEAEVLARWGGCVELAPMVHGRSTTRILRIAAGAAVG
jgi:D-beta-D-heptose 7-phosphate kinase/D-beta-D-heptose 1-phosphate adenosyltransferase